MNFLDFIFGNNRSKNTSIQEKISTLKDNNLVLSYKNRYLNKVVGNNKIVNIGRMYFDNNLIIYFDLMCCKCKRIQRVNNLERTCTCSCYKRRLDDWNIVEKMKKYSSFSQFISREQFNTSERYYVIDANKAITSSNVFKGTYENYLKVKKTNTGIIEKNEYLCPNCGKINSKKNSQCSLCRAIKYRANDVRNILSCRKYEKEYLDDLWDTKIIPCTIYINDNIRDFTGGNSAFPTHRFYFLKDDKLACMGLNKINELNNNYFIGDYIFYLYGEGFIQYKNIYDNYTYEFKPIIYYKHNNEEFDPRFKVLNNNEMEELICMYFEKSENYFDFYRYKNNQLINKICEISKIIQKDANGFLFQLKNNIVKYYSILDNKLYESGERQNTNIKAFNFKDYNTNIYINSNEFCYDIGTNLREQLNNIPKTDNVLYKKIYITKNEKIANKVLFKYLEDNFETHKIFNEFDDDKSEIYSVILDRNDKKAISFLEYLSVIKKADDFKYKIYGINIDEIISTVFSDYSFKKKVCNLIEKDIIKIENNELKNNYITKIYNYYFSKDSIHKQICEKLKQKYEVDDLGLLLILLYKYGEENILSIPSVEEQIANTCDNKENINYYNTLIISLDNSEIKWKSEFTLYKLIKSYFPDAIFQYRDKFLGLQSLDVYIPSLKIAFEYQGLQHYESVDFFGGEDEYLTRQINDKKKKDLCRINDILLIEWKYDESINKITLDKKLYPYKAQIYNTYTFSDIS